MGRKEKQNIMGRADRRLREDCGGCRASYDRRRPPSFSCGLRSCFRLVCPGNNPRQDLAKDSNFWRTAARYKVDSAKIATGVLAELSKAKVNGDGRPAQKRTRLKSSHRKQSYQNDNSSIPRGHVPIPASRPFFVPRSIPCSRQISAKSLTVCLPP